MPVTLISISQKKTLPRCIFHENVTDVADVIAFSRNAPEFQERSKTIQMANICDDLTKENVSSDSLPPSITYR